MPAARTAAPPATGATGAADTAGATATRRPTPSQVLSLAPDRAAAGAAAAAADPGAWSAAGCDDTAVWGRYVATTAEPYEVAVDLDGPAFRCSCPSRKVPCKHCLGLLLLHADERLAPARRPPFAAAWLQRRAGDAERDAAAAGGARGDRTAPAPAVRGGVERGTGSGGGPDPARDRRLTDRAERMRAGVVELERWLGDRVRAGLAAPELSDPATWERVAARLVDARCGALANRVKRIAALVGGHGRWHEDVLEELAVLHALAQGALRTAALPDELADGVHVATGLTVARDDVLGGVASTARWLVVGESRTREDRITVQRTWLCASPPGTGVAGPGELTWALVLAFGAFGAEVTTEHEVGTELHADLHWYPGATPLRAVVGRLHDEPRAVPTPPRPQRVADAVAAAGVALAREPWLERHPVCLRVVPVPLGDGRWVVADPTGALPIVPGFWRLAELAAVAGGRELTLVGERSAEGLLPLAAWADGLVVRW